MGSQITLLRRIRLLTGFFIGSLFLSGATAIPLNEEVDLLVSWAHRVRNTSPAPTWIFWLERVQTALRETSNAHPFLFYGTDWLAFGHFIIALFFIGAYKHPVRNRWLYQFGMIACALVPVWALVFGHLRGIPGWWQMIDASFGVMGFLPMWLCNRWADRLEVAAA